MYSKKIERFISNEFPILNDTCYLDHAGATLYANSQLNAVFKELNETVFGNPHSLNSSSRHTTDVIDQVRYRILKHFHTNANEYSVIFTSGATAALKLLGESFKWRNSTHTERHEFKENCATIPTENAPNKIDISSKESCRCEFKAPVVKELCEERSGTFVYLEDNHTSVVGLRELAGENGACVHCMPHDLAFTTFERKETKVQLPTITSKNNSLFVYPAQCNFSGIKYPLSWVNKVQSGSMYCPNSKCCHNTKWFCCLDAASYVATNDLDLSIVKPDFICVSFYKIFGYPTGLGALLVRNSSAHTLKRNYFGGGTVQISLSRENFHVPRPSLSDRFEDGTISFLSIVALRHGFDVLESLTGGMVEVAKHTFFLSRYVHHCLLLMHHSNGTPAAILYSDTNYEDFSTQGNIVNFNLLRSNGEVVGFAEVLQMANLFGIHLRTGCFCNPGACQRHLNLSASDLKNHFQAGHVCGDTMDLIEGLPTGSVRISFGYMSTKQDAEKFLNMISSCFVDAPVIIRVPQWWANFQKTYREKFGINSIKNDPCSENKYVEIDIDSENHMIEMLKDQPYKTKAMSELSISKNGIQEIEIKDNSKFSNDDFLKAKAKHCLNINDKMSPKIPSAKNTEFYHLTNIYIYPVKSCGPMSVKRWEISSRGLKYDREWIIVGPSGVALTQKQETKLCLVIPKVDLHLQSLTLQFKGFSPVSVPLKQPNVDLKNDQEVSLCESKVCGDYIQAWDCGDEVAAWLCDVLGREGLRLLRQRDLNPRTSKTKLKNHKSDEPQPEISLANQAQFLLINTASIKWLEEQLMDISLNTENLIARFRCNFVVEGKEAFEENKWSKVNMGNVELQVEGPCTRCQMICIDQKTGDKSKEPLRSLAAAFHGKLRFGIYLRQQEGKTKIVNVGDVVKLELQ